MICPNCGAQNRDDAKFCKACGTPFKPLPPGSGDSLATVAGPTSTETKSSMAIGLEAVFLSGLRKGERVAITTFPATIGRDPNSTLPLALQDQLASTRHAQIAREGSDYLLRDVGSSNGTYHNGHRVTEVRLKHEDIIEFGVGGPKIRFDFIRAEAKPSATAAGRFEDATPPPPPALLPKPLDVTISRKPAASSDVVPPAVSPDIETVIGSSAPVASAAPPPPLLPPLPPLPPPPAPFDPSTAVQESYAPPPGGMPPAPYDAPASVSPSVMPSAPPEAAGNKSRLILFIAIGVVGLLVLLFVAAVAAYLILLR
ncbi:MAG: hypothetical protein CFK52_06860 [Chloracidobacterium sp. CP2_5A]|nr:MAG: hypothetical protein CFK52_06860 [Chloracidobacterium sp. CP2_5A]